MDLDWEDEASWIWDSGWSSADEETVGQFVYFRKSFHLDCIAGQAIARISADSRYRLYVNGVSVSFGPCKGDRHTWYYESVDIAQYLKKGKNVISAKVLRYSPSAKGNDSVWRTKSPGFYLHCKVLDSEGECIAPLRTDETWRSMKDHGITLLQGEYTQFLGIQETVDGTQLPIGWLTPDFDDQHWQAACTYSFNNRDGALRPWELMERPIPLQYETARRFEGVKTLTGSTSISTADWNDLLDCDRALTIEARQRVIVDMDAGELQTGFLELSLSRGKGAVIRILCAECYEDVPTEIPWLRNKGDRTDSIKGLLFGDYDTYLVSGYGDEVEAEIYEPFWFRTFRYVRLEVETADQALMLKGFSYRETGYPLEVSAAFSSSDESYTKLWDISVRTLQLCMHESYEDCPYYEQLQYTMDSRSQMLFTYLISGDDRLARKTLYDFHSSLLPQGLTLSRYPSVTAQVIPGFSLHWIYMLHDHMMYYGDIDITKRYLASMDAILAYFDRLINAQGLVGQLPRRYWSFIDWTEEWRPLYGAPNASSQGPLTLFSLMYITALNNGAELAEFAGRAGVASEYRERAKHVRFAVLAHCRSHQAHGMFRDGPEIEEFSQHTQIWAVLSGVVNGMEAARLMKHAVEDTTIPHSSFAYSFYLFRALAATDLYEYVHQLWDPWHTMVSQNLTTWMEDTVSQRSDCHAWGSLPLYEFTSEILGVQPERPGFAHIRIQPRIDHLEHAEGQVVTPKGIVKVSWTKKDNVFAIRIDGPESVPLTLVLPNGEVKAFKATNGITQSVSI